MEYNRWRRNDFFIDTPSLYVTGCKLVKDTIWAVAKTNNHPDKKYLYFDSVVLVPGWTLGPVEWKTRAG